MSLYLIGCFFPSLAARDRVKHQTTFRVWYLYSYLAHECIVLYCMYCIYFPKGLCIIYIFCSTPIVIKLDVILPLPLRSTFAKN